MTRISDLMNKTPRALAYLQQQQVTPATFDQHIAAFVGQFGTLDPGAEDRLWGLLFPGQRRPE